MSNISDQLSAAEYRQIHEICGRFEAASRDGQRPQVEAFLQDTTGPLRDVLLAELIELDLELQADQQRVSAPVSVGASETHTGTSAVTVRLLNQYQQRFPDDLTVVAGAIERFLNQDELSRTAEVIPQDSRYEFLAEIARGGAGVVWRVFDRHMQRETAVKLLLDSNNNAEMRRRLQLEARLSGRLQHPGIVPVHELSQLDDGRPFITMKLVKGDTLAQVLKASPATDQQRLLQAALEACEAVGYAHGQGVIHRDLKPENIILGEFNVVQVMDWGLGKKINSTSNQTDDSEVDFGSDATIDMDNVHKTMAGTVFGTLAYMSPEQAQGKVAEVDERSDVFSLGAVLFRIVTGELIYVADDAKGLMTAAVAGNMQSAFQRLARTKASRSLKALIIDCLAVDPAQRPENATVVAGRLRRALNPRFTWRRVRTMLLWGLVLLFGIEVLMFATVTVTLKPGQQMVTESDTRVDVPKRAIRETLPIGSHYIQLADALVASHKLDEAERVLADGHAQCMAAYPLEIHAENVHPLRAALIHFLLKQGRTDEAFGLYQQGFSKTPVTWTARMCLGQKLIQAGRLTEAEQVLTETLPMNERHPNPHWWLGEALLQLGQFQDALVAFQSAKDRSANVSDFPRPIDERLERTQRLITLESSLLDTNTFSQESLTDEQLADLAELYAKQGQLTAAINVTRDLMERAPAQFGWTRCEFRQRMMFSVAARGLRNSTLNDSVVQQAVEFGIQLQQQQRDDIRSWSDSEQPAGESFLREIRDGLLTNQIRLLHQQNRLTEQAKRAFDDVQESVDVFDQRPEAAVQPL